MSSSLLLLKEFDKGVIALLQVNYLLTCSRSIAFRLLFVDDLLLFDKFSKPRYIRSQEVNVENSKSKLIHGDAANLTRNAFAAISQIFNRIFLFLLNKKNK